MHNLQAIDPHKLLSPHPIRLLSLNFFKIDCKKQKKNSRIDAGSVFFPEIWAEFTKNPIFRQQSGIAADELGIH
ncbi:MAG: hypothetical protein ACM3X0_15245 [Bacteroidota bacterium]